MTKTTIRNLALLLLLFALLGGGAAYALAGENATLNFLIAYVGAAFVVAASGFGYWQMVAGSETSAPHHDLPDIVESLDDRFGLWEEESEPPSDAAEALKREKAGLKESKPSWRRRLRTARPALSVYRLVAYALLLAGLLWLIRNDRFEAVAYLAGAGAAPMLIAVTLYVANRRS